MSIRSRMQDGAFLFEKERGKKTTILTTYTDTTGGRPATLQ